MDPPAAPPLAAAQTAAGAYPPASSIQHQNYQDSIESSPRSNNTDSWSDEPIPPVPGGKLRLMCSYGGHIIPRPHDKSLCYVGGETRIVVVDRLSSLPDICIRLSRTLINGRPFTLKYQLPDEDLDSLISIATDEDLENMIDEYDRITAASPSKPLRIRLFLFFTKPETTVSMGSLLDDAKHETWFVDALNNSDGTIPRGLSDSATMECMVNLDAVPGIVDSSCNDVEILSHDDSSSSVAHFDKQGVNVDPQSAPDSPAVEIDSSFGSSSSVPSVSNLPPIRVRADEVQDNSKQPLSMPMPLPLQNRGVAVSAVSGGLSLLSPDSVASDSSITSANSQFKPMYFQDQVIRDNTISTIPIAETDGFITTQQQLQIQQLHDPTYVLTSQLEQMQPQQFVHPATSHYLHHPHHPAVASGHTPVPSYYHPVYTQTPSQPQQLHHPMDQQYPVYLMPMTQPQPTYNMSLQSSPPAEGQITSPNWQASGSPTMVASPVAYNDGNNQPSFYAQKTVAAPMPEMAATMYRTAVTAAPPSLIQVSHNQFQQPSYVNYASLAPTGAPNYGFDYTNAAAKNIPTNPLASQYQTMGQAALQDGSQQQQQQQQQIRNT